MSRRAPRPTVRKSEIARALDALTGRGLKATAVEVTPDGTVRILTSGTPPLASDNAFEAWERKHGKST